MVSAMFSGKTIWITGASSGIGAALAKAFAKDGAHVILSGRRVSALDVVAAECGDAKTLVLPFETTDYDALPDMVSRAESWTGSVDILVNNAGISQRSMARETEMHVYRKLMEVDFFAPVALTKLLLPAMLARKAGHIVTISSVAGKLGAPLRTGYCAAKHACQGFFDALRAEEAANGIKVTLVTPGFVRTNIASNAVLGDGSAKQSGDPQIDAGVSAEEAAQTILSGMRQGKEEIPVGKGAEMTALWLKRLAPGVVSKRMQKMGAGLKPRRS